MSHEDPVAASFLRRVGVADFNVFHDFPFDCPAQRLFPAGNVFLEFLIVFEETLLSKFGRLLFPNFFSDFFDVGGVFLLELVDDFLEFVDFGLQVVDVFLFIDGFLNFDFIVLGRPCKQLVVLNHFVRQFSF